MRWRAAVWLGIIAVFLIALVGLRAWVHMAPTIGDDSRVGRATIAALDVAIIVALIGLLSAAIKTVWSLVRAPGSVEPQASQQAAERVANAALDRWEKEAHDRRITGPGQLPVAWEWADSNVATPAEQMNPRHDGPTRGAVTDLVNLYRSLEPNWRKLIILGEAGSGKTAAMVLLLIGLLKDRQPGERVPVWITLGSWNPNKQTLRDYAATVIGRDFQFTREQAFGGERGPKALLDAHQVELFLDGLDEMPADLRAIAAQEIHQERTLSIVMTSRDDDDEYASATEEKAPYGAVIQTVPLTVDQTIDALKIGHKANRAAVWERFTDRLLGESAESTLWTSPLTVSLLRQTYETSGDPCELFDREKFPNNNTIQTTYESSRDV